MTNLIVKFLFLICFSFILFVVDITYGSIKIPFSEVLAILFTDEASTKSWAIIVIEYRLPKAITAILAGVGLSVSGLQMQTLFRNSLASPDLLGMSSGASLGVAVVVLAKNYLPNFLGLQGQWLMVGAAICGAAAVLFLLLIVANNIEASRLLVAGLMITALIGALVSLLQYFSRAEELQQYIIWSYGAIGNVTWEQLPYLTITVFMGLLSAIWLQKPLNIWLLGEQYAQTLGVNVRRTKIAVILSVAILAGGITAFCGLISFVGVAVPHIAFYVVRTSNLRVLLPTTAILGAILLLFCDILCNLPNTSYTLPINIVTAILGSPLVIWLIFRKY
jgi:iron complex transport system permease protein